MSVNALDIIPVGVVSGDDLQKLFKLAKEEGYALPAVNVVSTTSVNAVLEAAKNVNSPIIVQFSNGGGAYYAGKGLSSDKAAILGTVSGAQHVHTVAAAYGVPVVL
ncbi:MAG: class II fructose-bisphosphate aldolase, partial [Epsilonproteobacteria bacterium]